MKELDILLSAWLAEHYDSQSEADKAAFRRLLMLPDPELARYLLVGESTQDPDLARVIDGIRGRTPD